MTTRRTYRGGCAAVHAPDLVGERYGEGPDQPFAMRGNPARTNVGHTLAQGREGRWQGFPRSASGAFGIRTCRRSTFPMSCEVANLRLRSRFLGAADDDEVRTLEGRSVYVWGWLGEAGDLLQAHG